MALGIIEDTGQKIGKHEIKNSYFNENDINIFRCKLPYGDYAKAPKISVDTKKDIQEIIMDVTRDHARFVNECELAVKYNAQLYVLIENKDDITCIDDLYKWYNPRLRISPKATKGSTLAKILHKYEMRHKVKFLFCTPEESGSKIVELLGGELVE